MLRSLIDLFFPPVCALCEEALCSGPLCAGCLEKFEAKKITSPLCTSCGIPFPSSGASDHECGGCINGNVPFIKARSAYTYDGVVLEATHKLKYRGKVTLAGPLGALIAGAAVFPEAPDLIVPVPLHKKRLRQRGFNQSLLLSREVSKALSVPLDYINLKRVRETEQQINLTALERVRNVSGAFEAGRAEVFKDKKVLLVDDVFTTGATIMECSRVLKRAGAKVFALTLARAVKV